MIVKVAFSFVIILFSVSASFSQKPKEFGEVSAIDFKLIPADTAEAVILFDKGVVEVVPGKWKGTTRRRHVRIKILKNSALEFANFKFVVERNDLSKPKGATYNLENGRIITKPLEEASILRSHENYYYDNVSITFPNVKEGSIIELSYISKNKGRFLPHWNFQYAIPTLWSEFTMQAPIDDYVSHLRGSIKPAHYQEQKDGKTRSWVLTNIPAFKKEPLMPDENAYISSVEFATRYKDWGMVVYDLNKKPGFTPILSKPNALQTKLLPKIQNVADSIDKIKIISQFLKNEIQYNGTDDFLADETSEIIDHKSGTTGDINLLLGSLLQYAGFKVNLVLLSTRDNGFVIQSLTSPHQFNYVVCQVVVNKKEYFLDATDRDLSFSDLPERCFNHVGLLISPQQYGWISVEPSKRRKIMTDANLVLNTEGVLSGKLTISNYDYAAVNARKKLRKDGHKVLQKDILGENLWSIQKEEILNEKETDKPLIENYEISQMNATTTPNLIYINPHLFLREEYNPFLAKTRTYPIDFPYLTDHYVSVNITIPDGFVVDELPEGKVFTLPNNAAKCTISLTKEDNKVKVISRLQINQTLFQPNEYSNLQEFYSRLVSKKSETIVLKRR